MFSNVFKCLLRFVHMINFECHISKSLEIAIY